MKALYRKKPLIIEAIQWNGNSNKSEIDAFVGKILKTELESETAYLVEKGPPIFSLLLETKEGIMKVSKGDWIIKEPFPTGDRDFYPCKSDIFENTYESELSNNTQKQECTWNLILEKLPPVGVEVLFQNDKWIDLDYNPKGIRIGFLDGTGDYYSAYWCTLHDEYHTRDSMDDDSRFKLKLAIDQIPIKWKEIQ